MHDGIVREPSRELRIGLNLLYLVPGAVGGTETYARELIRALALERPDATFVAFCGREAQASLRAQAWPANVAIVALPVRSALKPARILAELTLMAGAARRHRIDLLHSFGTTSPLAGRVPRVVTIHDLIYDHFPGAFPPAARAGLRLLVPLGARRARRVLVDSDATRRDVVQRLGVDPDRVDVAWLGTGLERGDATGAAELRERHGLGDAGVLLCVSPVLPHKNLDALVEVFAGIGGDPVLVIAGHPGRGRAALQAHLERLGLGDRVRLLGPVSRQEVLDLFAAVDATVLSSSWENFPHSIVESLVVGTPVIATRVGGVPEVVVDGTNGLLVPADDVPALAAAIARFFDDGTLQNHLRANAESSVSGYSADHLLDAVVETLEEAVR